MRILITLISFFFLFACQQGKNNQENNSTSQNDELIKKEVLSIGKMHCEMCVVSIEKGLGSVEGVEFVKVKLEDSTAIVQFDESKTNMNELRKVIEQRGYVLKNSELSP